MTADSSYYTYNYGPSWWQIVIVGLVILAVYDVAREQGFDRLADAWPKWRKRRRDWRERHPGRTEDASDDTPEPATTFTAMSRPLKWRASPTVIHRAHCQYAQTLPAITVWSEEAARHWAMAHDMKGCTRCHPFLTSWQRGVAVGERDE